MAASGSQESGKGKEKIGKSGNGKKKRSSKRASSQGERVDSASAGPSPQLSTRPGETFGQALTSGLAASSRAFSPRPDTPQGGLGSSRVTVGLSQASAVLAGTSPPGPVGRSVPASTGFQEATGALQQISVGRSVPASSESAEKVTPAVREPVDRPWPATGVSGDTASTVGRLAGATCSQWGAGVELLTPADRELVDRTRPATSTSGVLASPVGRLDGATGGLLGHESVRTSVVQTTAVGRHRDSESQESDSDAGFRRAPGYKPGRATAASSEVGSDSWFDTLMSKLRPMIALMVAEPAGQQQSASTHTHIHTYLPRFPLRRAWQVLFLQPCGPLHLSRCP